MPEHPNLDMNKINSRAGFAIILLSAFTVFTQSTANSKVIVVGSAPASSPYATPTPVKLVVTDNLPKSTPTPSSVPAVRPIPVQTPQTAGNQPIPRDQFAQPSNYRSLSFSQVKNKIAEARRQMQSRPMPTSSVDTFLVTDFVRSVLRLENTADRLHSPD